MNKKIKLMCYMGSFHIGGAEKQLVHLLNYLDENIYEIILVVRTVEGPNRSILPDRIKIIDLNTWSKIKKRSILKKIFNEIKTIFLLRNLLSSIKPCFIYGNQASGNFHLLLSKFLTSSRNKTKVVFSIVNNPKRYNYFYKFILFYYYKKTDNIFVCSNGLKKYLDDSNKFKKNKINIMYNCINIKGKSLEYDSKKYFEGFSKKIPNIISVARMIPQKGIVDLLETFKLINKKNKSRLIIIGDGPDLTKVKNYSKLIGLEKNVFFLGGISDSYKYVSNADLFLYTSKWDGLATVLLEACAVETPIVATDAEFGTSDVILNNITGLLVPVGDTKSLALAALKILNNKEFGDTLAKNAKKRLEDRFISEKAFKKIDEYFKTNLNKVHF